MSADHSELPGLLNNLTALIKAGKYSEVAQTYAAFVKEHPTTRFLAAEPIPFKMSDHLASEFGSSATSNFTLRNTTWAEDLKRALDEGPEAFAALAKKYEAEAAAIAKAMPKVA